MTTTTQNLQALHVLGARLPGWFVQPYGASATLAACYPPVDRRKLADHAENYRELRDAAGAVDSVCGPLMVVRLPAFVRPVRNFKLLGTTLEWDSGKAYPMTPATNQPDWQARGAVFLAHDPDDIAFAGPSLLLERGEFEVI